MPNCKWQEIWNEIFTYEVFGPIMGIKSRDSSQGIPEELIIDTNTLDMVAAKVWQLFLGVV